VIGPFDWRGEVSPKVAEKFVIETLGLFCHFMCVWNLIEIVIFIVDQILTLGILEDLTTNSMLCPLLVKDLMP